MSFCWQSSNEPAYFVHLAALAEGLVVMQVAAVRTPAVVLLASVLCNALLLWAALHYRDKDTLSGQALAGAVADAKACSAAVTGLSVLADQRVKESAAARQAASKTAGKLRQRADRTLSKSPAVPGDMCASMQALGDDWLKERQ